MKKTKQGISLIVLVITIIIMIILAAAIIISLNNTGIIGAAEKAVCKTNIKQAQNLAVLVWSNIYTNPDEYTMDNVEQKLKEEFEKNGLKYEDYNVEVTKNGINVSSKAGCVDSSGVEGGNDSGDTGRDVIPTNWDYAYTYDRKADTWETITTNDGTELTGDIIVRFYKTGNGTFEITPDDADPTTLTTDTYDMIVSGTGEFVFDEDSFNGERIKINGLEIECVVQNIQIKEGITDIGSYSFATYTFNDGDYGYELLKTIKLPNSLRTIGKRAFHGCSKLEELIIPEGVTEIASEAVYSCPALKKLSLPESITTIYTGASAKDSGGSFSYNDSLEIIILPATLTNIPQYTFESCENIKTIYYTGTEEKWSSVIIGAGNGNIADANVICNYVR